MYKRQALERTLRTQLFNGPDGRYYMHGNATSPCSAYAEDPHVTFKDDRVVVHVRTHSKLGKALGGACVGVSLSTESEVSIVPEAEGESVGFRDAKIEKISQSSELNFLLEPFLSHKLPSQMKLNAADLIRKLLSQSLASTGYTLTLDSLTVSYTHLPLEGLLLAPWVAGQSSFASLRPMESSNYFCCRSSGRRYPSILCGS